MQRNAIETVIGAVVIVVAALFVSFAWSRSTVPRVSGYELNARFNRAVGLQVGSDVRIAGVKVGSVLALDLNPETFLAEVRFSVRDGLQLPVDTSAAITSEGLLGDTFLALVPGAEETLLKPGDRIAWAQGSVDIFELIGKFVSSDGGGGAADGPAP